MAHYHTLRDENQQARLLQRDQRETVDRILMQLVELMGDEAYSNWLDKEVKDGDDLASVTEKAKKTLAELNRLNMPSTDEVKGYWRGA